MNGGPNAIDRNIFIEDAWLHVPHSTANTLQKIMRTSVFASCTRLFAMSVLRLFGGEWVAAVPFVIWLPQLPHCMRRIYLVQMSSRDAARPAVEKTHSSCWQQVT